MTLTRKSHNCVGTAFVQGASAGGSKLIEQTFRVCGFGTFIRFLLFFFFLSIDFQNLHLQPSTLLSHRRLGYVHTVPDSEMERRRKCTG